MATLILEILHRHAHGYHRVEGPEVRVGRALDNDIILSDPTVSPYHFVLRRQPGGDYKLYPLSDENGVRVGRELIGGPVALNELPFEFDAGRTHIRILDRTRPVAPTRLISGRAGRGSLFGRPWWALLLFLGFVLLSAADNYLSTPQTLSWDSYWGDQLLLLAIAFSFFLGLVIINRLTSQRWDFAGSLSLVSLLLIASLTIDLLTPALNYFFTSPLPGFGIHLLWNMVVLPFALGWYLIRFNHGSTGSSITLIAILLAPAIYLQLAGIARHYDFFDSFSKRAYYSDTLYPGDFRVQRTIAVEEFAKISADLLRPHTPPAASTDKM